MTTNDPLQTLANAAANLTAPQHPALDALIETLLARHGDCVQAVLFYGSCLRNGDPYDGLVDLYLVVDRYRCANSNWIKAVLNWLLPPNVFYMELPHAGRTVRCKYAILSARDLHRGTSRRWFHSYLWGRFSQPTAIAWSSNPQRRTAVARDLAQAVITLLNRALPALPEGGSVLSLWEGALSLSYASELRPEATGRAGLLATANQDYYQHITELAAPLLDHDFSLQAEHYRSQIAATQRLLNRSSWRLRSLQGKLLSLARLSKALLTFDGGLDYAAWKLERHSGQRIDIPERVRRYPLLFVWGMVWSLYRRGVFR